MDMSMATTARITARGTRTMDRRLHRLILALLWTMAPGALVAQTMQLQVPNMPSGGSAAAAPRSTMPASELRLAPEDFTKLKLAPGFLISLTVLEDADFNGNFRVDEQGNLAMPIIGILHVAGQTPLQAKGQIEKVLLDKQILNYPQVMLSVLEYTAPTVTIIGEVASPGKYPLLVPQKLVNVLALAGGPTLLAGNEVQINPGGAGANPVLVHYSRTADPTTVEDVFVRPGDTVQMKRAGVVYVLGAVNRPGGYVMQEEGELNILQAISLANGTSTLASIKTIYVLRKNQDGTEVDIAVRYKEITQGKSADMRLHATDILYVPTNTAKSILFNTQSIWSSAASAGIYAATIQ
jgi:polysaccharide biosynthesis/export protein